MDRKDTSLILCKQLDEDLKLEHEKLEEKYKKLKNKYHNYWWSLDFRTVKDFQCGYCGLHTFLQHKREIDGGVSQYGGSCSHISLSEQILHRISYNDDTWYNAPKNKIIKDVRGEYTTTTKIIGIGHSRFEHDFSIEEVTIIYNNLEKFGYFTDESIPKLTPLGGKRLARHWCFEKEGGASWKKTDKEKGLEGTKND